MNSLMSTLTRSYLVHLDLILPVLVIVLVHNSFASTYVAPTNSDTASPEWHTCLAYSASSSPSFQCKASANDGGSSSAWSNLADEFPGATSSVRKSSFPPNFMFGAASSAYQYEGAVNEGGRSPSIWDTYTEIHPEKIKDRSNGAVAVDSCHRFKEDVDIMKNVGFNAYRFSISWTRILPGGNLTGGANKEGIQYYNNLINELLSNGLKSITSLSFKINLTSGLESKISDVCRRLFNYGLF